MELFPAIDVHDGVAVRLVQGDFARARTYGDPVALGRSYVRAGASWVHVVDLDAARTGLPVNRRTVIEIAGSLDVQVQAGGGVRTEADAAELLDNGVARVVLGTAAVEDPTVVKTLVARYPGRIAVGLDHRGAHALAVRGWERTGPGTLGDAVARLAGVDVGALVVTSIDRDGTLEGPDTKGLESVLALTDHPVVASGGVRSAADLEILGALRVGDRRVAGVIVGTALVAGALTVEEAIAACARSG
jgi:phosphoribosylformimino-5-aminoimidazole carboxamide ribotide isomerase